MHKKHQLTETEAKLITITDGIVAHPSHDVYQDPETGDRWALCFYRVHKEPHDACDVCGDEGTYQDGACFECFCEHQTLMLDQL